MKHPRLLPIFVLTLTTLALSGCQLLSFAFAAYVPKPKVKPVYDFPATERLAVFPDAQYAHLSYPPVKDLLARKINRIMAEQEIAETTIPYRLVEAHQTQLDREYRAARGTTAPLDALATKVAADRLLYVDIRQFRLRDNPHDPVWRGRFLVYVKVVDSDGQRLWPMLPHEGHKVLVTTPASTDDSESHRIELTEELTDLMADKITKLFYEHRPKSEL